MLSWECNILFTVSTCVFALNYLFLLQRYEPTNGPTSGGTEIQIFGSNLGTDISDIDGVTFGSNPCTVIPQQYKASVR